MGIKKPASPGMVVFAAGGAVLVAVLAWNDRHDLTGSTMRGYPTWVMLLLMSALCCLGAYAGWRWGPDDEQ